MSVIYVLLPLALLLAALAVGGFVWAVRRGQFDDLETPAIRVLFDERAAEPPDDATTAVIGEPGSRPGEGSEGQGAAS